MVRLGKKSQNSHKIACDFRDFLSVKLAEIGCENISSMKVGVHHPNKLSGQAFRDTSPYKVSELSLVHHSQAFFQQRKEKGLISQTDFRLL